MLKPTSNKGSSRGFTSTKVDNMDNALSRIMEGARRHKMEGRSPDPAKKVHKKVKRLADQGPFRQTSISSYTTTNQNPDRGPQSNNRGLKIARDNLNGPNDCI